MSSSEVLGILRGAAPPPEDLLLALRQISAHFRVSFTPEIRRGRVVTRPPVWWLHEVRPNAESDGLRRHMGRARLRRLSARPKAELDARIGDWWDAEFAASGLYLVGYYYPERVTAVNGVRVGPEEIFGTTVMLDQLRRAQAMLEQEQRRAQLETERERGSVSEIKEEMNDNPEFASFVRDVAKDFYLQVSGAELVLVDGFKGGSHDESHGQPLGESGHGGDCEPGQHPDGPAGQPAEDQVRPGGDGAG